MDKTQTISYKISNHGNHYCFQTHNLSKLYTGNGFMRKAIKAPFSLNWDEPGLLQDLNFKIFKKYKAKRLYQFYGRELDAFEIVDQIKEKKIDDSQDTNASRLKYSVQEKKPSFVSQIHCLNLQYTKTLLISKFINSLGFYQYFVKRNGVYYVDFIDDKIPIDQNTQKPIWDVDLSKPWHLIFLKIWLKQKNGIQGVLSALPFEFLNAFGLPAYKILSVPKQLSHCLLNPSQIKNCLLLKNKYQIVLKTSTKINKKQNQFLKNQAGYKLLSVLNTREHQNLTNFQFEFSNANKKNQKQLLNWKDFNQTFATAIVSLKGEQICSWKIFSQDWLIAEIKQQPSIFAIQVVEDGLLNINVFLDIPVLSNKKKFPTIKILIAKVQNNYDFNNSIPNSDLNNYCIDFINQYHHSCNSFIHVTVGKYLVYVDIGKTSKQDIKNFVLTLNTNSNLFQFKQLTVQKTYIQMFLKHFFMNFSKQSGHSINFFQENQNNRVRFDQSFDRLGYSYMTIQNDKNSLNQTIISINKKQLQDKQEIYICSIGNFEETQEGMYFIVCQPNQKESIVFQKRSLKKSNLSIFDYCSVFRTF